MHISICFNICYGYLSMFHSRDSRIVFLYIVIVLDSFCAKTPYFLKSKACSYILHCSPVLAGTVQATSAVTPCIMVGHALPVSV